jgi:alkylation response protein AidB-like acyl-CoA dehydrogenase
VDFSRIILDPDEQAFWRDEVVPFYDEHLSDAVVERERREGNVFDPDVERAVGQRGWLEPTAPEEQGGAGLDPVRAALVLGEEARRAGVHFVVKGSNQLVMEVVRRFGTPEVQAEVIPAAAAGTVKCCLGYTEPDCGSDAAAITTRAVRDGGQWVVNGQKMFSTGAHLCQYAMVTARTNPDAPKHRGITPFLVPLDQPGWSARASTRWVASAPTSSTSTTPSFPTPIASGPSTRDGKWLRARWQPNTAWTPNTGDSTVRRRPIRTCSPRSAVSATG